MVSSSLSVSLPPHTQYLQILLDSARPFLRDELHTIDPNLPSLLAVLRSVGAGECWHKHGTFLQHLLDTYRILHLWKAPSSVSLCGLFHSAYSNSYVNLAIFDPSTGREIVRSHVGNEAERLIHLFCIVPRQPLIHDDLLFKYSDYELVEHLKFSELSLRNAKEKGLFNGEEGWRKKLQSLLPADGVAVKHIRTGEAVHVSRRVVAVFLMMTMADFSDQLFGFQDTLFDNIDGHLEFSGNNLGALWPGDGKPGLWLNSISRMAAVYSLIVREEEIFSEEKKRWADCAMAMANSKNSSRKLEDIDLLKSDVASFASSLGLSTSLPSSSSGFNDVDFRKKGTMKLNKPSKKKETTAKPRPEDTHQSKNKTSRKDSGAREKPKPKPSVLSLEDGDKGRGFNKFRNLPKLPLMKASALGVWYVDAAELEAKVIGEGKRLEIKNVEEWKSLAEKKREMGERLMAQYVQDYESSRGQSGDIKMLISTQRSGTAVDKVSAFSVMVGDNPIANLRSLDSLLGMVTSKVGKRHALTGFEALKELFISSLLPDRKLKTLIQRPINHVPENKDGYSLLLFWYWEECLKQRYERFVVALEEASRDMLPVLKNKALKSIYILLRSKSEQERRLLSALVNKLGDPDNRGASNADFHLSNLLSDHPNMKSVVIDEVDSFLFRPHLGPRAQYHAVNCLSQIRLTHKGDGPKVAKRLIDVYFALFKVLITGASSNQKIDKSNKANFKDEKSKDSPELHAELDSRLLSALLTGVNRAFPFVSSDEADDIIDVQTPVLFQLVHSKNFNVGVQALMLLDKISSKNQIASDRFYRALYSKLLLPAAMHTSKAEMFIGLILRAMKRDVNLKRVAAFSKRLLQVALQQPPQYACACLFLLSELLKARPPLWNLMLQNESIDEEIEHFEDVKEETDNEPSVASIKQDDGVGLVQNGDDSHFEDESSEKEDDLPKSSDSEDDSDYASEDADFLLARNEKVLENTKSVSDDQGQQSQLSSNKSFLPGGYNPRHREPSYCNADRVSWWEVMVLASHSHPSVATMARTLLSGANIVYNGNPLNDLSLTAFLDKFMEKKPKQSTWHGGSQIEPAKQMNINNHLIGPEILLLAEVDVPPEDLVFHKFYTNKMNTSRKPKKKKKKTADEEAAEELFDVDGSEVDGGDDSDNEEIENLLDNADQSLDADGEYDYDDLDKVTNEDDEDLIGDVSDAEMEVLDMAEEDPDTLVDGGEGSEDHNDIDVGAIDDDFDVDEEDVVDRRKRKGNKKSKVSPFASYEDYEHLMEDDNQAENISSPKKRKSKKNRR